MISKPVMINNEYKAFPAFSVGSSEMPDGTFGKIE